MKRNLLILSILVMFFPKLLFANPYIGAGVVLGELGEGTIYTVFMDMFEDEPDESELSNFSLSASLVFGYAFENPFRAELEYFIKADSNTSSQAFLINAYYTMLRDETARLYIGGGLGGAKMDFNLSAASIASAYDESAMGIAFNLKLGAEVDIYKGLLVDAGLRYMGIKVLGNAKMEEDYRVQHMLQFIVGLRYQF